MKSFLLVISIILSLSNIQSRILPPLSTYFSPKEYSGGTQNWCITQDWDGYIYIANNLGVFVYDGIRWQTVNVASKNQVIRSLYADNKTKRIYVGLFEEFGYLKKEETGEYNYTSLSDSIQNYQMSRNNEIWNIVNIKGKIYFQSFASFFVYDGKICVNIPLKHMYLYFLNVEDELYAYVLWNGLSKYDEENQKFTPIQNFCSESRVIQVIPYNKQKIIITEKEGIFLLGDNSCERIDKLGTDFPIANRAIITQDSTILLGSINKGVFAFDIKGNFIWELNNNNGLKNNTVLNLFEDSDKNVWVALDKGIALLHLNSSLCIMNSEKQNIGAVYSAAEYNGTLYLGTNHGLFKQKDDYMNQKNPFVKVDDMNGQIWYLKNINNQFFVCANDRTHTFYEGKDYVFSPAGGGTSIKRATLYEKEVLIQSTFSNICIYLKDELRNWDYGRSVKGLIQPIKTIEVDYRENIWASHFYKGLYKLRVNKDLTEFTDIQYFQEINGKNGVRVTVSKINNRVVFSDEDQLYIYNDIEKKIIPYDVLNDQLGTFKACRRIIAIDQERYWIICKSEIVLARISNETVNILDVINTNSFASELVDGAEIVAFKEGKHLICLDNGYILYSEKNSRKSVNQAKLQISSVIALDQLGGEKLISRFGNENIIYKYNTIMINLAYPLYGDDKDNFMIKYKLKDESNWIVQKLNKPIILAKLNPDDYDIDIHLIDISGKPVDQFSYSFTVNPPFYQTTVAKIIYFLVFCFLLFIIYRLTFSYFERKRLKLIEQMTQKQLLERKEQEKEIIRLRNEKLESEIIYKSKELANYALQEVNHNETLNRIREAILEQKKIVGTHFPQKVVDKLIKTIDLNLSTEKDWLVFQQNFDLIHEHFFRTLNEKYPELTPNDLRLCAYIRLNLSTKEMANLLNITIKGIEVARYRLRKKLNLSSEISLLQFMLEQKR